MSKNKGFDGGAHNTGGAIASSVGADTLEKLCELLEVETVNNEAVLACLAELKLLTAANNDATALAMIIAQLEALCEKLLAQADQNDVVIAALESLCEKLLATNESLEALCAKIEEGNADQLTCLEDIKAALADVITALEALNDIAQSLEAICTKLDTANASLEALCGKLDAILAALVAQTLILTEIEGNQTGMSCDEPTFVELCGFPKSIECCKAPPEGLTVDSWCQRYEPTFPIGNGEEGTSYSVRVDGEYIPLPNPYTQADLEAALDSSSGTFQILDGFLCRTDGAGSVSFRCCGRGDCVPGPGVICNFFCSLTASVQTFVPAAEPVCQEVTPTLGCYDEPIADTLTTSLAVQEDILEKACSLADLIKLVPNACAESAVIGWCGRPDTGATYAYGDIEETGLGEFNTAWIAAGGKTWIAADDGISGGECHWFCPAIEGATFTINGVAAGNGNIVVSPNPNAEALGCEPYQALTVCAPDMTDLLGQLLAKQCEANELQELANAKLCIIENNTNTAAPCAEPVEGLDKEALTLTIAGDVVANYPEGQAINLQNANAEPCGTATSAGGATFDGTVTVIPITECELDEGKEAAVIVKAQPVKQVVATAIKTVKTLTAVRTLTKATVVPIREVTLNTFQADAGSFVANDSIRLLSADRAELGTATVTKVSETSYGMEKNTVAEADLSKVAFAEKITLTKTAEKV